MVVASASRRSRRSRRICVWSSPSPPASASSSKPSSHPPLRGRRRLRRRLRLLLVLVLRLVLLLVEAEHLRPPPRLCWGLMISSPPRRRRPPRPERARASSPRRSRRSRRRRLSGAPCGTSPPRARAPPRGLRGRFRRDRRFLSTGLNPANAPGGLDFPPEGFDGRARRAASLPGGRGGGLRLVGRFGRFGFLRRGRLGLAVTRRPARRRASPMRTAPRSACCHAARWACWGRRTSRRSARRTRGGLGIASDRRVLRVDGAHGVDVLTGDLVQRRLRGGERLGAFHERTTCVRVIPLVVAAATDVHPERRAWRRGPSRFSTRARRGASWRGSRERRTRARPTCTSPSCPPRSSRS